MHADNRSTKHRRTFACLLLLVVVSSHLPTAGAAASTSPWLTAEPTRKKLGTVDPADAIVPSMITNRDCQPSEIITRPSKILPPQSQQSHDSCIVDTGFGAVSESGYLQRQGSDTFGLLRSQSGSPAVVGIPRTNNAMVTLGSSPHGAYIGFYNNLANLVTSNSLNGIATHTLPATPSTVLSDHAGHQLGAELSSLSFSEEGDWAVVEIPTVAIVRINTASHEVLPFADAPETSIGTSYRTAVSANGRYAVVISKTRSMFTLYDLSTCASIPATIITHVACLSIDLLPYMQKSITGYSSVASVRFRGEYSLELYINTSAGIEHDLVTATGQEPTPFTYLALGDSFAAGEGSYQYKALTDTSTNGCHLSLRSYPYLISRQLHLGQSESVACSGAYIDDVINSGSDYRLHHSQAKGKEDSALDEAILSSFLPGYRAQKLFTKRYTPQVMTISVGGNDMGFADILIRCIGLDTCYANYEDRLELFSEVSNLFPRLSSTYTQLKQASPASLRVYVVGYPELVDAFGNCALNVHLNYDERLFVNTLAYHLDSVVRAAAEQAGVTYLDVSDALHGHRLCETSSANVAVNGLTVGNDVLDFLFVHGPIAKESYHPNNLGHELLASKIMALTNNFEVLNSAPKPQTKTVPPDTNSPSLKVPRANRPLRKIIHKKGSNTSVAKKGSKRKTTYSGVGGVFKPGSTPKVVLDGSTINGGTSVGTVTVNPDNTVDVELTPPPDTTDGPHTIDIIGDNTTDEPVDVTETIVVGGDNPGPCGAFPASGIDVDADGIDDACDAQIGYGTNSVNTGQSQGDVSTGTTGQLADTSDSSTPPTQPSIPSIGSTPTNGIPTGDTPISETPGSSQNITNSSLASSGSSPSLSLIIQPANQATLLSPLTSSGQSPAPTQSLQVATQAPTSLSQVKSAQVTQPNLSTTGDTNTYPPASIYKSLPRLDFIRVRNLFLLLLVILLVVSYLLYKRRKARK